MIRSFIAACLAVVAAALLAGCANLGLEAPQNAEDRIQYAKATIGATYRTIGDQVAAKAVTPQAGAGYFARVESVEKQVAVAEQLLRAGKPTDTVSTLNLALQALTVIRAELAAKKGTP